MASKKRRGPKSLKSEKKKKAKSRKQTATAKRSGQTNEPFEQDSKRRIGQHVGTGTPPIMKK
jgi:hypothetical protein